MNSFGTLFKLSIFGESHGPGVGVVLDGVPAGMPLNVEEFESDLSRRRAGAKGTTPRVESDIPQFLSGVFNGKTTGSPLTIYFENKNTDSKAYSTTQYTPRPGHADFVAHQKFGGFQDYRGGGHFSGRLTVCLVAAGVVAKKIIAPSIVKAELIEVGGSKNFEEKIDEAIKLGDSVGGVVSCSVKGLAVGLGEPFFDSVESVLSHAIFSIPAIKGIEFGDGFNAAKKMGSEINDAYLSSDGKTASNHAGGINGGLTNGMDVEFRVAVKPTSSIKKEQQSIDLRSGEQATISVQGRHDACIALRVPPVIEAVTACVLADLIMRNKSGSGFNLTPNP